MADDLQALTVEVRPEDIANWRELVARRGLSANTVLQQALSTERLIADNVGPGDKLLIKKADDSWKEVVFSAPGEKTR